MIESIGWLGAVLLATCGLPQLYKSVITRNFDGLSLVFLFWWVLGEIFLFYYSIQEAFVYPLLFNFGINIVVVFVILLFYLKYGMKKTSGRPGDK